MKKLFPLVEIGIVLDDCDVDRLTPGDVFLRFRDGSLLRLRRHIGHVSAVGFSPCSVNVPDKDRDRLSVAWMKPTDLNGSNLRQTALAF